jgi:hypothetical protein
MIIMPTCASCRYSIRLYSSLEKGWWTCELQSILKNYNECYKPALLNTLSIERKIIAVADILGSNV